MPQADFNSAATKPDPSHALDELYRRLENWLFTKQTLAAGSFQFAADCQMDLKDREGRLPRQYFPWAFEDGVIDTR